MQPRNEKFFPFAGQARTPSSAAILPEVVVSRERWAKLAKWTTTELHGRRSPNRPFTARNAGCTKTPLPPGSLNRVPDR